MHIGVKLARSAVTRLNLIDDEKHIFLFNKLCNRLDESLIELANAALALNKLHHNCDALVGVGEFLYIVKIIGFGINKSLGERSEIRMENILTRCLERCDRSAVEAVLERDYC